MMQPERTIEQATTAKTTLPNGIDVRKVQGGQVRQVLNDLALGGHDKVYPQVPERTVILEDTKDPLDQAALLTHELTEREKMAHGQKYEKAHAAAAKVEQHIRKQPADLAKVQLTREGAKLAFAQDLQIRVLCCLHGQLVKHALVEANPIAGSPSEDGVQSIVGGCGEQAAEAPGCLVDLDGTIRETEGQPCPFNLGEQRIRPGVIDLLKQLRGLGFRIVGVTNHVGTFQGKQQIAPDALRAIQHETMDLCGGTLDDVLYCNDDTTGALKPEPTMLQAAIKRWRLKPDQVIMVGDSDDDRVAAQRAGVPFSEAETFFADPEVTAQSMAKLLGAQLEKKADTAALVPRAEYLTFNPEGRIAARPRGFRRYEFPTEGQGKPAPYEKPLRFVPPEGVPEPGAHGYELRFMTGESPEAPKGYEWQDPQQLLKSLYGAMGKRENLSYREADRARARVILRYLRRRKPAGTPVAQTVPTPA